MKKIMMMLTGMILTANMAFATSLIPKDYVCESEDMYVNIYANGTVYVDLGDGDMWTLEKLAEVGEKGEELYSDGANVATLSFSKGLFRKKVKFKLIDSGTSKEGIKIQHVTELSANCKKD
jgi:hypothetical protein